MNSQHEEGEFNLCRSGPMIKDCHHPRGCPITGETKPGGFNLFLVHLVKKIECI